MAQSLMREGVKKLWLPILLGMYPLRVLVGSESEGGGGSLVDLFPSAFNFVLLFSFIFWKIKGPLVEFFDKNRREITLSRERAQAQSREAQLKLEKFEQKMKTCEADCQIIVEDTKKEIAAFEKAYEGEIKKKCEQVKTDMAQRLEAERGLSHLELQRELVELMVAEAKSVLKDSPQSQGKVTEKLIEVI